MDPTEKAFSNDIVLTNIFNHLYDYHLNNKKNGKMIPNYDEFKHFLSYRLVSKRFSEACLHHIGKKFKVTISYLTFPYDGIWKEGTDNRSLNTLVVVNDWLIYIDHVASFIQFLLKSLKVNIDCLDLFPLDRDLSSVTFEQYGFIPRTVFNIYNKLKAINDELGKKINFNPVLNDHDDLKKSVGNGKISLGPLYLERTAEQMVSNPEMYDDKRKEIFRGLSFNEVDLVINDSIKVYEKSLFTGPLTVPNFQPYDVIRDLLLNVRPKILNIKLQTQVVLDMEDAYRLSWDEPGIIQNCMFYKADEYDTADNISIGNEKELNDIAVLIDTAYSCGWNTKKNKNGLKYGITDMMSLFTTKTLMISRCLAVENIDETISLIPEEVKFIVKNVLTNRETCKDRNIHLKMIYMIDPNNVDRLPSNKEYKRIMPKSWETGNIYKVRVEFNSKSSKDIFNQYSDHLELRYKNVMMVDDLILKRDYIDIIDDSLNFRLSFEHCLAFDPIKLYNNASD